ncbi:MAG: hypothetical protein NW217_10105 [Hyphomicrobiaceae bacterium]|nr:hypothetical protein [Hyphomicrobiaceae bacterium]
MTKVLIGLVALALLLPVGPFKAIGQEAAKPSLHDLAPDALERLRTIGRGYGASICGASGISTKDEIKPKAWSKIQQSCSTFTLGLMDKMAGDPNQLFSLCIGASLFGCQSAIGILEPCEDLKSCQASLGVP